MARRRAALLIVTTPRFSGSGRWQKLECVACPEFEGFCACSGVMKNRLLGNSSVPFVIFSFVLLSASVVAAETTVGSSETGRLTGPATVELLLDGRVVGNATLPEGTLIRIHARDAERAHIESRIGSTWVPADHVNVTGEPIDFEEAPTRPALHQPVRSCRPCPNAVRVRQVHYAPPARLTRNQQVAARPTGRENVPSSNQSFERAVLELTNQSRRAQGLPALQWSESLARAARYHAAHMAQYRYFDHDTRLSNGQHMTPAQRIGLFDKAYGGENIANGQRSPQDVMRSWMNSSGHRTNILRKEPTRLGVGYVAGYWVQVFGR